MKRIGIISDSHGYLGDDAWEHMEPCDEIWHAGDIGNIQTADILKTRKSLKAVHGNIDNHEVRLCYPEVNEFQCENKLVTIKHIVGYPGRYDKRIYPLLEKRTPHILIAGHSHILKIQYDNQHKLLFINPGAVGKNGFHQVRTLVRITLNADKISDCEVVELGKR